MLMSFLVSITSLVVNFAPIIAALFLNINEIGLFAAAYSFMIFLQFIPRIMNRTFYPNIAYIYGTGNLISLRNVMKKSFSVIILVQGFISVGILIFSDIIITLSYGINFKDSAILLLILLYASFFATLGSFLYSLCAATDLIQSSVKMAYLGR